MKERTVYVDGRLVETYRSASEIRMDLVVAIKQTNGIRRKYMQDILLHLTDGFDSKTVIDGLFRDL